MDIYVGNISFQITDEQLQKEFSKFGHVSFTNIIKDRATGNSKGFAFIEMPNDNEAKNAIKKMNGKELLGRTLKVNESIPLDNKNNK